MKKQLQYYSLWMCDTWGNCIDGYTVNDVSYRSLVRFYVSPTVYGKGTEHEVVAYDPTDKQLDSAVCKSGLVWSGESDCVLYAETECCKPVCELARLHSWDDIEYYLLKSGHGKEYISEQRRQFELHGRKRMKTKGNYVNNYHGLAN